ncbi:hypothetical protein HUU05_16295 [candidate division KSB1 bacterium]|nr:hypothetical protein [candidate division KSB1 bacterium]
MKKLAPSGSMWHAALLSSMQLEIPQIRPAVVSRETAKQLKTFLDFRHKFRHLYGFDLEFEKLEELDGRYPTAQKACADDINLFLSFLSNLISALESND